MSKFLTCEEAGSRAAAVLQSYRPGSLGHYDRRASADVEQLTPGNITNTAYRPEWPFGHGLSYTEFEFSDLELDKSVLLQGDELEFSVTVTNSGDRDGWKAVDLYISDLYASLAPATMKLKGFDKVLVPKGESTTLQFRINEEDLSFVNADLQRVAEAGDFEMFVGGQEANFSFQYADNNNK
ncbi:MAG: fibronectin type III-like domain-contianing protein [Gammaproteobacteria bacterium]|nr:fibronectin type III-like domain-contianing protein [Gammaproteobacteria bacterium]